MTEATPDARTLLPDAEPLRIAALDPEELAILSAHLQDANVRVGDMAYLPDVQAVRPGRSPGSTGTRPPRGRCERCGTGLHFERVSRVRRAGFQQDPDAVLTLLAISFMPTERRPGPSCCISPTTAPCGSTSNAWKRRCPTSARAGRCSNPPEREGVPKKAQPA